MAAELLLVPTDLERRRLADDLAESAGRATSIELCGFGPIAAAARTAELIAARRPARVILAGIAGRLDARLEIGAAYRFDEVACDGVGVGSDRAFVAAGAVGWPHWPGNETTEALGDRISLAGPSAKPAEDAAGLLLTVCAASANPEEVACRRDRFPEAVAEEMEGFGVAVACRLSGVPLVIVRGISNDAGDRDHARWRTAAALEAAAATLAPLLAEGT